MLHVCGLKVMAYGEFLGALLSDFVKAVAHRETAWLERYAVPQSSGEPFYTSAAQNDPGSHIALLQKLLQVAEYLFPKDPDLQQPTIWHSDIHPSNLFVSGGQITSLIDWQDVWAGPLCFQARIPRIFNHVGEVVLERPGDFETLEQEEQDYIDKQLASTTVQNTYASQTSIENPTLDKLYDLKYLKTRMEPVMFAGESWDDNIVRFRECLIKLERLTHLDSITTPQAYMNQTMAQILPGSSMSIQIHTRGTRASCA
jgi:hypothetical protein